MKETMHVESLPYSEHSLSLPVNSLQVANLTHCAALYLVAYISHWELPRFFSGAHHSMLSAITCHCLFGHIKGDMLNV